MTLNIVAHPDDDLLFQNPDILHDIDADRQVYTVYLTAGDAGQDSKYWTGRQEGIMEAYATMAGMPNTWDAVALSVGGKDILRYTLRDRDISLVFMHLPDENSDGDGFDSTGHETLEKLWKNSIPSIRTVDDESDIRFTSDDLIKTLRQLMDQLQPDSINSLDFIRPYGLGDHSDHTSTGLFANEAAKLSSFPGDVEAHVGYPIKDFVANVTGDDLDRKRAAFYTYGKNDIHACASEVACAPTDYPKFLPRQYVANNMLQNPKIQRSEL
jgi:LmbE family N-acetylglucosaminyl deacetylase